MSGWGASLMRCSNLCTTRSVKYSRQLFQVAPQKTEIARHHCMMEHEYCLLAYQNKCTTEWGLLSFIHMQSHSNEHPLHNPSRTWPSLKALQQCGPFYPTTALKNPLIRRWTRLIRSPSSVSLSAAARRAHIVGSNYLWLFICLTASRRGALKKSHSQEQLTEAPAGTHLWLPGCDLNHDVIGHRLALRCLWAWRPGRRRSRGVGGFVCAAVFCSGINEGLEALWNSLCKHSREKNDIAPENKTSVPHQNRQ